MKFKIIVTTLLAAILSVCIYTSYTLIEEEKQQSKNQFYIAQMYLFEQGYNIDMEDMWFGYTKMSNLYQGTHYITGEEP